MSESRESPGASAKLAGVEERGGSHSSPLGPRWRFSSVGIPRLPGTCHEVCVSKLRMHATLLVVFSVVTGRSPSVLTKAPSSWAPNRRQLLAAAVGASPFLSQPSTAAPVIPLDTRIRALERDKTLERIPADFGAALEVNARRTTSGATQADVRSRLRACGCALAPAL